MAMMAMTTRSSIRVNAARRRGADFEGGVRRPANQPRFWKFSCGKSLRPPSPRPSPPGKGELSAVSQQDNDPGGRMVTDSWAGEIVVRIAAMPWCPGEAEVRKRSGYSAVPAGLAVVDGGHPALKRRAIVGCPSGTKRAKPPGRMFGDGRVPFMVAARGRSGRDNWRRPGPAGSGDW